MLTEKQIRSLDSYFGFAMKKRAVFVGMKMEELLSRKRVGFLLILPSCSSKKEEELRKYKEINPDLIVFRYCGKSYDVKKTLGYELLNAVAIKDCHLAKAIKDTLSLDTENGGE